MKILSETEEWVVISKPSGWLSIPASRLSSENPVPVLSEQLAERFGAVWVVHRLDRETSGVILFAKTAESHAKACLWFQNRKVKKTYLALASGCPTLPVFKLNEPIEGAPSVSQIEVKDSFKEGFFASITPRTGRRHQIRKHLAGAGYPIWGDSLYRGPKEILFKNQKLSVGRVALHAHRLELPSGEKFEAPLETDFSQWLETLKAEGIPS